MEISGKVKKINEGYGFFQFDELVNLNHLETLYKRDGNELDVLVTFIDKEKVRPQQRRLFFAFLHDIFMYTGTPEDVLKDYFYSKYKVLTYGGKISLSDKTESTVSHANLLLNIVVDFIFEWHIPLEEGYKLLPKNWHYYLYKCCMTRKCAVCGQPADIHHETHLVGMGGRRKQHNHTKSTFIALCREHHTERHTMTWIEFTTKYHVEAIKLSEETIRELRL